MKKNNHSHSHHSFTSGPDLAAYYIKEGLEQHPFFKNRNNYTLTHLWALLMAGRSFKDNEAYWVTHFSARIKDNRIRSPLIADLNDDLGNGEADKSHTLVYSHLIELLQPWALPEKLKLLNAEDKRLAKQINKLRTHKDLYIALGATLGSGLFTNIIIKYMVETLTLHKDKLSSFDWFHQHMSKTEHDDGLDEIAHYIPKDDAILNKVALGNEGIRKELQQMLDLLNSL